MARIILFLVLISPSSFIAAQSVHLQKPESCFDIPGHKVDRQEPMKAGKVDLIADWVVAIDSIFRPGGHKTEIYGDLFFSNFFIGKAIDITNGRYLSYGQDKFPKTFSELDLIITDRKVNNQTFVDFILLATGDTINTLRTLGGVSGGYKFFRDSIFWGSDHFGIYAYSLSKQKKVWEKSTKGLQRYENYFLFKGNNLGAHFYYMYNNYRIDSTLKKDFFVRTTDWTEVEIELSEINASLTSFEGNSMYFTSLDENTFMAVDIDSWTTKWCISGDWRRFFLEDGDGLVSVDHTINLSNGKVTMNNTETAWMQPIVKWGSLYVLKSSEGHGANEHIFLSQKDFTKYYEVNIVPGEQLPCNLYQVIWEGGFKMSNSGDKDRSVGYFTCNNKTYLVGLRLISDSFKEYGEF